MSKPTSFDNILNLKKFYKFLTPSYANGSTVGSNNESYSSFIKIKENVLESHQTLNNILSKLANSEDDKKLNKIFDLDTLITSSASDDVQITFDKDIKFKSNDFISKEGYNFLYKKDKTIDEVELQIIQCGGKFSRGEVNAEDTDLFLNAIPTIEMSKCIPYFDIYFEYDDFNVGSRKVRPLINERNFFQRSKNNPNDIKDPNKEDINDFINKNNRFKKFGMEFFTMPQSLDIDLLFSPDERDKDKRQNIPHDKFEGLLSIDSFTIEVRPSKGFQNFKTAQTSIKIAHRTKLRQYAHLFKAEFFNKTSIVVTYGWLHPEYDKGNVYADFINSKMLKREVFGISTSTYNFEEDGAVTVNLELYFKFIREFLNVSIATDEEDLVRFVLLDKISEQINSLNDNRINNVLNKEDESNILVKKFLGYAGQGTPAFDITINQITDVVSKFFSLFTFTLTDKELTEIAKTSLNLAGKKNLSKEQQKQIDAKKQTIKGEEEKKIKESNDKAFKLFDYFIQYIAVCLTTRFDSDTSKKINELDLANNNIYNILSKKKQNIIDVFTKNKNKISDIKKELNSTLKEILKDYYKTAGKNFGDNNISQIFLLNRRDALTVAFDKIKADADKSKYKDLLKLYINEKLKNSKELDLVNLDFTSKLSSDDKNIVCLGDLLQTFFLNGAKLSVFKSKFENSEDTATEKEANEAIPEIQIFSYSVNNNCGILSNLPILAIPIEINEFRLKYQHHIQQKQNDIMTFEQFMTFFIENELQDSRAIWQPTRKFYKPVSTADLATEKESALKTEMKEDKKGTSTNQDAFNNFVLSDDRILPSLSCYIETVVESENFAEEILRGVSRPRKKIVRIHIYDESTNPFEIKDVKGIKDSNNNITDFNITYNSGETETINNQFELTKDFDRVIKNFLSRKIPTIDIGSSTSNVQSISVASNANPKDSTVRYINYTKGTLDQEGGQQRIMSQLPMRIIPASVSMSTVGCPSIQYMQQLFINLGTGTNIDSIYSVVGISHSISKGKFDTSLTLVPVEGFARFESAFDANKTTSE